MNEQLWREILRGMDVVTADGHTLGKVAEVYFTELQPGPEPGSMVADRETDVEDTGEGSPRAAATSRTLGTALDADRFFRVARAFNGDRQLLVPLAAIGRVHDGLVELRLSRDEIERQDWE